ncbi:MAG TPA: phosphate ABC transporter ATP-binding protein PstB [Candidatus Micrarchaeaceae archaeon]|nr:phosphate ABC transporter ATP-binding protein PstB [Candidatus Micrarchaeaceae archaeon]
MTGMPLKAMVSTESRAGGSAQAETRPEPAVTVRGLGVRFGAKLALSGVDMDFPTGRITALIGPSGCGKTTLLRSLNRLHETTPGAQVLGSVHLGDLDIYSPQINPTEIRARIGMVFQRPNPFPTLSIYDNVVSGLRLNGIRKKSILNDAAETSLRSAALWDSVSHKLKTSAMRLSGGEQQRLCIARALAVEPDVLLMDEPTSALDPIATSRIESLLRTLVQQVTIIIVTHNMQQAARVSDYCAFLMVEEDRVGHLVEEGPTLQIFSKPADPRTEEYVTGRIG